MMSCRHPSIELEVGVDGEWIEPTGSVLPTRLLRRRALQDGEGLRDGTREHDAGHTLLPQPPLPVAAVVCPVILREALLAECLPRAAGLEAVGGVARGLGAGIHERIGPVVDRVRRCWTSSTSAPVALATLRGMAAVLRSSNVVSVGPPSNGAV
jgi:hypothetical protein